MFQCPRAKFIYINYTNFLLGCWNQSLSLKCRMQLQCKLMKLYLWIYNFVNKMTFSSQSSRKSYPWVTINNVNNYILQSTYYKVYYSCWDTLHFFSTLNVVAGYTSMLLRYITLDTFYYISTLNVVARYTSMLLRCSWPDDRNYETISVQAAVAAVIIIG